MSRSPNPALSALIRASADRVLTQHGVGGRAFALERLRASEEAADQREIAIWKGIASELELLLRTRRV